MILVSKYHSDLVNTTHVHLAHECESRGNYRAAENHFVQAGEWKLAVKMYRSLDMWEEAYKASVCVCVFHPKSVSAAHLKYTILLIPKKSISKRMCVFVYVCYLFTFILHYYYYYYYCEMRFVDTKFMFTGP